LNIPGRFDGSCLLECVCQLHPHIRPGQWLHWFDQGHILQYGLPVRPERKVRGGEQFVHRFPATVEPAIATDLRVLVEDQSLLVLHKPAPMPVHPSGRFNRNTLVSVLRNVYDDGSIHLVHRLDANTTGVLLIARTKPAATNLRQQFQSATVSKTYLTRCHGHPQDDRFECNAPISRSRSKAGCRITAADGLPAKTLFRVARRCQDGTSIVEAQPVTGRTNQIRIHLWQLQLPIVGDPSYRTGGETAAMQTLRPGDPPMCLHAWSIELQHPATGRSVQYLSPPPEWFRDEKRSRNDSTES